MHDRVFATSRITASGYCLLNFVGGACLALGVGLNKADIALMIANAILLSLPYPIILQGIMFAIGLALTIVDIKNLLKSPKVILFGFLPFLSGALLFSGIDKAGVWLWLVAVPVFIGVWTGASVTDRSL